LPVDQLAYERIPVDSLSTFDGNPRKGNVEKIAASLERHGQYRPIVVNAGSETGRGREVLAGNHTLMAARSLGWSHVDACLVDVDDETAKSIVAADNKLADLGGYDDLALFSLLDSLEDLGATGYKISELEALRQDLFPPEVLTDPDEAPSVPADPISELGQIWQLGKHRLLVGDSTDLEAVRALLGDEPPDCVWTDPPYGVDYVGGNQILSVGERKKAGGKSIDNDGVAGLPELIASAFCVVVEVCKPGSPVYVCHADTKRQAFESSLVEAGVSVRQNLIWVKDRIVPGRSDYHYRHEPILYGFTPGGSGRLGRGGPKWSGDHKQTTVFEVQRPSQNKEHPTMKPVALIDAMLQNSLPPGGIVFDPFGGSGSTLIAAHNRGCRAFCVELDPRYADVILTRFQRHTGVVPVLDGEPVSFVPVEAA
jgi:DNA modification methylase